METVKHFGGFLTVVLAENRRKKVSFSTPVCTPMFGHNSLRYCLLAAHYA
jgi:hypothetical protein